MALLLNDLSDLWRPSTILGLSINEDDILAPLLQRKLRRQLTSTPYGGPRHILRQKTHDHDHPHHVTEDKNKFQVSLDVSQFNPEEISVKASGEDLLTVEGKHDEREDEHGWISRHFVRKYKVPKGHDLSKCSSKLSSDGVLMITAPKKVATEKSEINIPITFTNQPSVCKKDEEKPSEPVVNGEDCKCTGKQKQNSTEETNSK